jgi:hypothetical protein
MHVISNVNLFLVKVETAMPTEASAAHSLPSGEPTTALAFSKAAVANHSDLTDH